MGIVSFIIAAVLSMPKQLIGVYLGTMLQEPGSNGGSTSSESEKTIVNALVLGATVLITIAAMWYIVRQMNEVKPGIIYERRKARCVDFVIPPLESNDDIQPVAGKQSLSEAPPWAIIEAGRRILLSQGTLLIPSILMRRQSEPMSRILLPMLKHPSRFGPVLDTCQKFCNHRSVVAANML